MELFLILQSLRFRLKKEKKNGGKKQLWTFYILWLGEEIQLHSL